MEGNPDNPFGVRLRKTSVLHRFSSEEENTEVITPTLLLFRESFFFDGTCTLGKKTANLLKVLKMSHFEDFCRNPKLLVCGKSVADCFGFRALNLWLLFSAKKF